MQIGSLKIDGFAALAPMAGVADIAMRELCRGFGAAYTVGELVSAKGVSMGDKKSAELLTLSPKERPSGVQLFGNDAETIKMAAEASMKFSPDFVDINMGCPAPKIVSGGGGSALHKDPELAGRITEAVVSAVALPVTVKIRAGWDKNSINAVEMAKICESAGASAIAVHGRTREQMYSPPVDLEIIRRVKHAVNIPVIGNGDIVTPKDAANMLEYTGCDFLMIGRGAMGSPWIFQQINAYLSSGAVLPDPPLTEKMRIMLSHMENMTALKGEYIAMREARKHTAWYMKGLHGAAALRRECGKLETLDSLKALIYKVLKENN